MIAVPSILRRRILLRRGTQKGARGATALTAPRRRSRENPRMRKLCRLAALPAWLGWACVHAATTVPLPAWVCGDADSVFRSGFETGEAIPHEPSNGAGGLYPGDQARVITVPGLGSHAVFLHIPAAYTPARAWPLLLALHGRAGYGGDSMDAARQVRSDWSALADAHGFVVVAPVASGAEGGWDPDVDIPVIFAALDDTMSRYDIERSRIDMWGYSAGAFLAHGLALNHTDFFAAYGVSAGSLTQYACSDSGSPPPSCSALLAGAEPKTPVDIHLGVLDPLYTIYGAGDDPARFEAGGWVLNQDLFYTLFAGGHTYTIAQLGEIWTNICPFALGP
jgi:predicted esterase